MDTLKQACPLFIVKSLYRAGLLKVAARELTRYKLDVVGVQEVRWDKGDTVISEDYNFFYGKGKENHQLGIGFLYTTEWYQQLRE